MTPSWCVYLEFKLILLPGVLCLQDPTKSLKQVETLPFPCFFFPHPSLLSITPWPFTDWLQLRPWISSSWTKVRLQCKNNKGKTNVLQSSMYCPQTAFGVKLYLELPHFKSLKTQICWFGNLSASLQKKNLGLCFSFSLVFFFFIFIF